jgi:hypothetical protein
MRMFLALSMLQEIESGAEFPEWIYMGQAAITRFSTQAPQGL